MLGIQKLNMITKLNKYKQLFIIHLKPYIHRIEWNIIIHTNKNKHTSLILLLLNIY